MELDRWEAEELRNSFERRRDGSVQSKRSALPARSARAQLLNAEVGAIFDCYPRARNGGRGNQKAESKSPDFGTWWGGSRYFEGPRRVAQAGRLGQIPGEWTVEASGTTHPNRWQIRRHIV